MLQTIDRILHRADESGLGRIASKDAAEIGLLPQVAQRVLSPLIQLRLEKVQVETITETRYFVSGTTALAQRLRTELEEAEERSRRRTRFDLGEVNLPQREARQSLVKCSSRVGQSENNTRLAGNIFIEELSDPTPAQKKEASEIGIIVLDALFEAVHPIRSPSQVRGNGRRVLWCAPVRQALSIANHFGRTSSIVRWNWLNSQSTEVVVALRQGLRMANGIFDVTPLHPRLGQEAMLHSELMLSADSQVVSEHQIVVLMDRSTQAVLHW
mmetsp:Transcript_3391/g.9640  ORF Transcript_3391/g.9640 Transcript_3391/m.9640 type:complete len:270 (-) Transcript_3391:505-1314(-)